LGGDTGANITITNNHPEQILFNETAGTFLVEVTSEKIANKIFAGIPYTILGKTQNEKTISVNNLFDVNLSELTKAWKEPMQKYF
jgi:phosphoribosylformylglycinamidine (FGAM) synthase-like enzyme